VDKKLKLTPPIIRGWGEFDKEEVRRAVEEQKILHMFAGVSAACDLNCIYCQTKSGKAIEGELTLDERKDLLEQAKELGCKMVHIAARGEPTVDPLFSEQLRYMHKLGITPVIYTHAGNIDDKWADLLWETESSVMVKIHSFDEELQDFFAGKKGYAKRRFRGVEKLIEKGFNKTNPTRLGADILVMKKNYDEIPSIFKWCRDRNIFPLVKPFLCNEKGKSDYVMNNLYIPSLKVKELYEKLSQIDQKDYGYYWEPTPPYAGINCNYYYYNVVVTIMGDVWPCIGLPHLVMGNIREKSLKECLKDPIMNTIRNINKNIQGVCKDCDKADKCYGCPCRRSFLKGPEKTFICESCWEDNL